MPVLLALKDLPPNYPDISDVEEGVTFGKSSNLVGTFAVPAQDDVASGIMYGSAEEFTGSRTDPTGITGLEVKRTTP